MAGLLGQTPLSQKPQEELIFQPLREFDLAEMPKGLLNNFEGGPINAVYALQDYGDQSLYGIQFAVKITFRTEDGDEGEEWYPAGDLRYFRPGVPGSLTPIALPNGYYDDKQRKYFIPDLQSATREQLDQYNGDVCFAAVKNGKQSIFSTNKKFGQLLKKAEDEGWPYDKKLLYQSISACMRTMYGKWDRVASKSGGSDKGAAPEGLGAEGGEKKRSSTSQTLLLTQYIPPPPTWGVSAAGVATPNLPSGWVNPTAVQSVAQNIQGMPPAMPQMPTQAAPQTTTVQAPVDFDTLVAQLTTMTLGSFPKGQPVPLAAVAIKVMEAVKAQGHDSAAAWVVMSNASKVAAWAQVYGWVHDPAANTLMMR